jgi:nucleoside-diphosphate-sugar epimerase
MPADNVMNLLLTGASGQLGQNIAPLLASHFSNIYEISRHDKPTLDRFKLVKADITDNGLYEKLDEIRDNIDIILHMAAHLSSGNDISDWSYNINVNIIGTHKLLKWAARKKARAFYFISSYIHLNPKFQPFSLSSNFLPASPYALSKLANELEIIDICKSNKIRYAIFRLPSIYGPHCIRQWTVLPIMIKSAILNKSIEIFGEGSRSMNFVHSNDVYSAISKAVEKDTTGVFHVGAKRSVSMLELSEIIAQHLPGVNIIKGKKSDSKDGVKFEVDISNTIEQLGWEPLIDISQGVSDAILAVKKALTDI